MSERGGAESKTSSGSDRSATRGFVRNPFHRDFKRTVRRDLEEIYGFYVDEDDRARLAQMRKLRRSILLVVWLLKSLFRKLSPVRRTLLMISLICLYLGDFSFEHGNFHIFFNFYIPSILILLWIVMLELKDKLVVREEMEIGRAVQLALLPDDNPAVGGWGIWMMSRPANDVGGDLADYMRLDGGRLGLSLGDVTGKGLGAALLMGKLQATIRAIAPDFLSLAELGARINRIFCRDCDPTRFATLVYAELTEDLGLLRILNAGHPPPVVVRAAGVEVLSPEAPPIGMLPDALFVEQHLELQPGDMVLFYSDGLTEARDRDGIFFGEERLYALLPALRSVPVEDAGVRIVEQVDRFIGDARASDDLTVILLQRL